MENICCNGTENICKIFVAMERQKMEWNAAMTIPLKHPPTHWQWLWKVKRGEIALYICICIYICMTCFVSNCSQGLEEQFSQKPRTSNILRTPAFKIGPGPVPTRQLMIPSRQYDLQLTGHIYLKKDSKPKMVKSSIVSQILWTSVFWFW